MFFVNLGRRPHTHILERGGDRKGEEGERRTFSVSNQLEKSLSLSERYFEPA